MSVDPEKTKTPEDAVQEMYQQEADAAWKWLLGQPQGRLIISDILEICELNNFEFHGNQRDTLIKGRQQVGATLLERHIYPYGMKNYTLILLDTDERMTRIEQAIADTDAAQEENFNE